MSGPGFSSYHLCYIRGVKWCQTPELTRSSITHRFVSVLRQAATTYAIETAVKTIASHGYASLWLNERRLKERERLDRTRGGRDAAADQSAPSSTAVNYRVSFIKWAVIKVLLKRRGWVVPPCTHLQNTQDPWWSLKLNELSDNPKWFLPLVVVSV